MPASYTNKIKIKKMKNMKVWNLKQTDHGKNGERKVTMGCHEFQGRRTVKYWWWNNGVDETSGMRNRLPPVGS